MFFIPGFVISIATFPGVVVHEFAHMLFCRLRGVKVLDVCFFRVGNPAGYVVHERTSEFTSTLLIAVGPFIVNTLLCLFLCLLAFIPYRIFGRKEDPLVLFQLWLGISIGMHAFPSTGDARGLWAHAKEAAQEGSVLAYCSYPLVGFIYLANVLSFFWFDAMYGMAVGIGLPMLVVDRLLG
jgi:hypothetical protein